MRQTFKEDFQTAAEVKYDLWPIYDKRTGELVGHCDLLDNEVDGAVEIENNYILAQAQWGEGYATEIEALLKEYGFEEYRLKRLVALIDSENIASEKVAKRIGMHCAREIEGKHGIKKLYEIQNMRKRSAPSVRAVVTGR